jgi:LysM repeat protein
MRRDIILALVGCLLLSACATKPTPTPEPTSTPLPTATATSTPVPTRTRTPTPTVVPTPTVTIYVVQAGDVLGVIARKYGTTVEAIVEANRITDPDFIVQGQELVIPTPGAPGATATPAATP